jgi:hypothetical protein
MAKPNAISHDSKLIKIDGHPVTRVQSFSYDTNMDFEDQYEIGNENILESRVNDIVTSTVNMTANDWGTVDLFGQIMSEKATLDTRQNLAVVTQAMLKNAEVDITVPILEDDVWKRTVWLPNCYLSSFSFAYDVTGKGSETYGFDGIEDYDWPEDYHVMVSEEGTYASSTTFDVTTSATGFTGEYISVNDIIYGNTMFSWATTVVTVSGTATTLKASDRLRLAHYDSSAPASTFTKLDTAGISTVHAGQVKIGLGSEAVVDGDWKTLKIQSVAINGTVDREENRELGTKQIVGRTWRATNCDVSITVDESDLEEYAYFCGVSEADWADWSNQAIILYPTLTIGNENELMIQIYDDSDQSYLLKTITMQNLSFTGKSTSQDVQAKGAITYTLRGSYITVSGNAVPAGSKLAGANVYPGIWV